VKISKYSQRKPHLEGKSPQKALTKPFLLTTWHETETPVAREQKQARCKPRFRSHSQIWCSRIRTLFLVGLNEVSDCEMAKSGVDLPSHNDTLTCQWAKKNELSIRALKDKAWKVEFGRWLGMERHDGGRNFANSRTISPVQPAHS
jgi:hypothetical protein